MLRGFLGISPNLLSHIALRHKLNLLQDLRLDKHEARARARSSKVYQELLRLLNTSLNTKGPDEQVVGGGCNTSVANNGTGKSCF